MQTTSIEWADFSWNPVRGCSRISPGCMNCYAERIAARFPREFNGFAEFRIVGDHREAHWTGKVDLIESKLLEPLSWRKKALRFAREHGRKPRVFISMSDLFHERLPDRPIDRIMAVAALCPEMNFLFLTKRAERLRDYFCRTGVRGCPDRQGRTLELGRCSLIRDAAGLETLIGRWPLPNVWLGVSVEDQKRADERIEHLRRTTAAVRFLSVEPMLEEIRLRQEWATYKMCYACGSSGFVSCDHWRGIDWVICGGESGAHARPFDLAWARSLRDQCRAAGVAFFMKQFGSNAICSPTASGGSQVAHFGEMGAGKVYFKDKKGGDPAEWPEDLRIQEVPGD